MSVAAPDTTVVALSSSNPAVASVPASVTVPANSFTGTFTITTSAVAASTTVTITATLQRLEPHGDADRDACGRPPPAPTLQSLFVSPSSVAGGSGTQGVVMLSGAAPAGGATVSLSSSNPRRGQRARERHRRGGQHPRGVHASRRAP